jgi:hypothetical protein
MSTVITKALLGVITKDVVAALKAVGDKHGVAIAAGGGQYSNNSTGVVKLSLTAIGGDSRLARDFKTYASTFGVKPEDLGRTFRSRGTEYKVTGINPGRPKFPFAVERVSDGKVFKFTEEGVRIGLGYPARPSFADLRDAQDEIDDEAVWEARVS